MLELHIADKDITGGSIAVSWCVDKETLDFLATRNITNPYIVFCMTPHEGSYFPSKEIRKIVPLKDLMTYLEFRSPGKHTIHAFISLDTRRNVGTRYLSKEDGEYLTSMLDTDGEALLPSLNILDNLKANSVDVHIPKECFASSPPKWEQAWVNHFFSNKPGDQCSFRRRRLFAYLVQPFLMLGSLLIRSLFLMIGFLWFARGLTFKYLLHPLRYDLRDSVDVMKGSYLVPKLADDDDEREEFKQELWYVLRKVGMLIFAPILVIPIAILWYYHKLLFVGGITLAVIGLLIVGGACLYFIAEKIYLRLWNAFFDWWDTKQSRLGNPADTEMLICNGQPKPTNISQIPMKRLTISLFYQGLKNKVCKPFAK